ERRSDATGLPQRVLGRDLPRAGRAHEHVVRLLGDRHASWSVELARPARPPEQGVRVEKHPHCRPSNAPALELVRRKRLEELLPDEHLAARSEEHTSELQSLTNLVCRLLLEKKKQQDHRNAYGHNRAHLV